MSGPAVPAPPTDRRPAPDRYADAVRARRAELRAARTALLGGHRAELRHGLAVARLAASTELAEVLAGLDRELRDRVDRADRAERAELPALVAAALHRPADRVAQRFAAAVLPGVRRVAAVRGLPPPVAWPGAAWPGSGGTDPVTALLTARPPVPLPAPDPPPSGIRALLTGTTGGTWRLALLPVAALSAAGLPALGGRSLLPAAAGIGVTLLVVAVRARHAAAERARLRRWCAEVVATLRQAWETELVRRLLEVEHRVGAALDDAVARRRAALDAELRALAPGPGEGARAAG
jgi:hypothetical protein